MKKHKMIAAGAWLGMLMLATAPAAPGIAQSTEEFGLGNHSSNQTRVFDTYASRISFIPPADDGAPRSTRSGASRLPDQCGAMPLLPKSGIGLTANEQPSLFLYFSQGSTVDQAILSMKAADQSEIYETTVSLPQVGSAEKGAVVKVNLPESLPSLEAGKEYTWSLVLMCNGQLRPDSPVLEGGVKRVAPIPAADETSVSLAQQAEIYGNAGLWYDLLSTLALMREQEPENAQPVSTWSSVLNTAGLEEISNAPLIAQ